LGAPLNALEMANSQLTIAENQQPACTSVQQQVQQPALLAPQVAVSTPTSVVSQPSQHVWPLWWKQYQNPPLLPIPQLQCHQMLCQLL